MARSQRAATVPGAPPQGLAEAPGESAASASLQAGSPGDQAIPRCWAHVKAHAYGGRQAGGSQAAPPAGLGATGSGPGVV